MPLTYIINEQGRTYDLRAFVDGMSALAPDIDRLASDIDRGLRTLAGLATYATPDTSRMDDLCLLVDAARSQPTGFVHGASRAARARRRLLRV